MDSFKRWVLLIISFLVFTLILDWFTPYDDSDDKQAKERSGLSVYTDHLTGCQYLGKTFGPPTPRMGKDGKQVCK